MLPFPKLKLNIIYNSKNYEMSLIPFDHIATKEYERSSLRKFRQISEICRERAKTLIADHGIRRDIAIRHESNVSNAIFDAVSRGIKDATVNLGGSSFRWRNTIVRRCRWPEVCSKGTREYGHFIVIRFTIAGTGC